MVRFIALRDLLGRSSLFVSCVARGAKAEAVKEWWNLPQYQREKVRAFYRAMADLQRLRRLPR